MPRTTLHRRQRLAKKLRARERAREHAPVRTIADVMPARPDLDAAFTPEVLLTPNEEYFKRAMGAVARKTGAR